MMKRKIAFAWVLLFGSIVSHPSLGALDVDETYAFKRVTAAVVNLPAEPVHGEQVEAALSKYLKDNSRYDFSPETYVLLKDKLRNLPPYILANLNEEQLARLVPFFRESRLHALVLGEVLPEGEGYQISLALVNINPLKIIQRIKVPVADRMKLASFADATREGLDKLMKAIPFDATILNREGYRIVIDRGSPVFRRGMQLPIYTLESKEAQVTFRETGTFVITRAEKNLSFGKVIAEKRPLGIAVNQKVVSASATHYAEGISFLPPSLSDSGGGGGGTAVLEEDVAGHKSHRNNLGFLRGDLGFSSVSFSNVLKSKVTQDSASSMFPSFGLTGELWFTSEFFFDLGFRLGSGAVAGPSPGDVSQSSKLSKWLAQVGYRYNFNAPEPGPFIQFRFGLGGQSYSIAGMDLTGTYTGASYSGLNLGIGGQFPLSPKYGLGADLNFLMFGSLTESPVRNGDSSQGVSGWDLVFRGYYQWTADIELSANLVFQANGADFTGPGSRPGVSVVSASQASKALIFGATYYF